jgi:hypothetical protein
MVVLAARCGGRIALTREKAASYIPGKWALPLAVLDETGLPDAAARNLALSTFGTLPVLRPAAPLKHRITHWNILCHPYRAEIPPPLPRAAGAGALLWIPRTQVRRYLTSSLFFKALARA